MALHNDEIDDLIRKENWGKAVGTAIKEDCPEEYRRRILECLISKKLVVLIEGFEEVSVDCLSSISINLFFRICNCLRKDADATKIKINVPVNFPRMINLGRSERGEVVVAKIICPPSFLRYDGVICLRDNDPMQTKLF